MLNYQMTFDNLQIWQYKCWSWPPDSLPTRDTSQTWWLGCQFLWGLQLP